MVVLFKEKINEHNLISIYRSSNLDIFAAIHDSIFKKNLIETKEIFSSVKTQHNVDIEPELHNFFEFLYFELQKDFGMTKKDLTDKYGYFRVSDKHCCSCKIHSSYIKTKLLNFYRFKKENKLYKEDICGYGNISEIIA